MLNAVPDDADKLPNRDGHLTCQTFMRNKKQRIE